MFNSTLIRLFEQFKLSSNLLPKGESVDLMNPGKSIWFNQMCVDFVKKTRKYLIQYWFQHIVAYLINKIIFCIPKIPFHHSTWHSAKSIIETIIILRYSDKRRNGDKRASQHKLSYIIIEAFMLCATWKGSKCNLI